MPWKRGYVVEGKEGIKCRKKVGSCCVPVKSKRTCVIVKVVEKKDKKILFCVSFLVLCLFWILVDNVLNHEYPSLSLDHFLPSFSMEKRAETKSSLNF